MFYFASLHSPLVQHLSGNNHQTAMQDPPSIADFAAAVSQAEPERQQKVLEERNVQQRLEDALHLVKEELVRTRLQVSLNNSELAVRSSLLGGRFRSLTF